VFAVVSVAALVFAGPAFLAGHIYVLLTLVSTKVPADSAHAAPADRFLLRPGTAASGSPTHRSRPPHPSRWTRCDRC
jgi:hypothetical protein